jgi:hypothetical protein
MSLDKTTYVRSFIEKLGNGEYMMDSKANEIMYTENETLAVALHMAIEGYDYAVKYPDTDTYRQKTDMAWATINAAFIHNVVINKNDLRTKLKQTEELLTRCEDEKARLEKDNNDLRTRWIDCNEIKKTLEEQLSQVSQSQNNHSDDI